MRKHWIKIAVVLIAFIAVLVVTPFFVNADSFRPMIESKVSAAIGRQISLGRLDFSLLSGSLVARNIAISDDPAFSTAPFLQAHELYIGVQVIPLLLHHQVRVTRFTLDSPSIQIIHAANGKWNFSSLGSTSSSSTKPQPTVLPDLTVGELAIKNGSATISSLPATGKPFVYTKLDLTVKQFSFVRSVPFELSAMLPGSGALSLSGVAGPLSQRDAAKTPFKATLRLKSFDPVASGVIDPGKGISMLADVDAQVSSDGDNLAANGKVIASRLQLARTGSPAPHPIDLDFAATDDLDARSGKISDIAIHTGSVAVHIAGNYRLTPQTVLLDLHLNAPSLPIDQVEELLPAFGIQLPSGSQLRGGTLSTSLAITGPAAATSIAGPVEIDNTLLAGFDLGSQLQNLNLFGKTTGGTQIQVVRTTVNSTPQLTSFSNIYANLPQIGSATGNGTVSPSGALNFQMQAQITSSNTVGAVANEALGALGGFLGDRFQKNTSKGIPLTITGTAQKPLIHANVGAMFR
ncbi:MAG: AsmA family protein [Terracidiphilus sp.]